MNQTALDRSRAPEALRRLYAPVQEELDQVEELLRQELSSDYPVRRPAGEARFPPGRQAAPPGPGSAFGQGVRRPLKPEHLGLAAMVELIHTATLIHDDVLDEATLRRHLDTVNARWDNEASVLLGDYLFARAINLAAAVDDTFACRSIGEASRVMCEGELRQIDSRGNYSLAEDEYLEIIGGKTAALTACCCRLGRALCGRDRRAAADALTRFGHHLGIAFQIADDLLDVLGDEATAGKSLGTDLVKQKPTLPLIRLLGQSTAQDRATVLDLLRRSGNHHREALRPWFERCDAIAYARGKAEWFTAQAVAQLSDLPANPAVDALRGLSDFVVNRQQ